MRSALSRSHSFLTPFPLSIDRSEIAFPDQSGTMRSRSLWTDCRRCSARAHRMEEALPDPYTVLDLNERRSVMADFTPTQGRYLAFIHAYTEFARLSARRIRDRRGHVRLAAVGESDGEDAGEERADPAPVRASPVRSRS